MTRNSEKATETAALIRKYLGETGGNQSSLGETVGTSSVYVNHWTTGRRVPSAGWVDIIATGLKLSNEKRAELHRAAARDHGFKIDLT